MKLRLLTILLVATTCIHAQTITMGKATFNDLSKKIAELKRSSVSIESAYKNLTGIISLGSGFIATKHGVNYAVTNFHVIKNIPKDHQIFIGMNVGMKKQYVKAQQIYFDEKLDIAVMRLGETFYFMKDLLPDSSLFNPSRLGVSMFEESKEIKEGDGVILIGYPLGIGSELTGNQPMSRIGIISQSVNKTTNTFFIDGIASHGNSGSPVFNAETGKLLGMIIGFPNDFITAYDETGQLVARLPYNSGLSLCITAEAINKIIP